MDVAPLKFNFPPQRKRFILALFVLCLVFTIGVFSTAETNALIRFNSVFLTAWFGINTYLYSFRGYVEVANGKLRLNSFPSKIISLNEITDIRYAAGDYILTTPKKKLRIIKSEIQKEQVEDFEKLIGEMKSQILN